MDRPATLGELVAVVLATGRCEGNLAAAELWCHYAQEWDPQATRDHLRFLRRKAAHDEIDERIAEYVGEISTLMTKLNENGMPMKGPSEINSWFRDKTRRADPGGMVGSLGRPDRPAGVRVSQVPARDQDRFLDHITEAFKKNTK